MSKPHLLAYFSSDYSETDVSALFGVVKQLDAEHAWVNHPPEFVEHDDALVGISFELTVDQLAEPLCFINALSNFSRMHAVDFEFEANDERVGAIENGFVEHTIQQLLLNTWSLAESGRVDFA
jgi:hypothetical protein